MIELLGPPTKEEEALIESEATVEFVRKVTPDPYPSPYASLNPHPAQNPARTSPLTFA